MQPPQFLSPFLTLFSVAFSSTETVSATADAAAHSRLKHVRLPPGWTACLSQMIHVSSVPMDLRDDAELMMRHCAHAWRQGVEGIGSEAFF